MQYGIQYSTGITYIWPLRFHYNAILYDRRDPQKIKSCIIYFRSFDFMTKISFRVRLNISDWGQYIVYCKFYYFVYRRSMLYVYSWYFYWYFSHSHYIINIIIYIYVRVIFNSVNYLSAVKWTKLYVYTYIRCTSFLVFDLFQ